MGNCLTIFLKTVEEATENLQEDQKQQAGGATHVVAGSGGAPYYDSLPAGAEQCTVRNVYDGDTLTLTDERRVRFLGIDTPEIKENQPFAQEAKAYTKSRCDKKTIWLTYDREKEDHYGRLLAHVWVQESGGKYLCVNEGIVAAGLASVYAPSKDKQSSNYSTLLQLQKQARAHGYGMHKSFDGKQKVVKTANGSAYHVRSCEHLASVRHLEELTVSEAQDRGLHPCRTCMS